MKMWRTWICALLIVGAVSGCTMVFEADDGLEGAPAARPGLVAPDDRDE